MQKNNNNKNKQYLDSSEDFLLNFFNKPQSQKEEEILELLNNNPSWPILYHLSPQRQHLLGWYPFKSNATLLEVGAGCGALTGLFCKKVKMVYANELVEKRSKVIKKRYSDIKNLSVINGSMYKLILPKKVDYIVAVGILEYAGRYFENVGENTFYDSYLNFLKSLKQFLNKDGKLLLAIENKLGLKYIAGGKEDHYARVFEGIENYPNFNGVRTFTKNELIYLLNGADFSKWTFYYPFPDYKLPYSIFSEEGLKGNLNLSTSSYGQIIDLSNERIPLFNEIILANSLYEENILEYFANSFLVEVSI
ncbi:class I SAM-dependent methyltransferase [Candidatus Daviesbacteria bacterium]|nr:class I SAM-dependent methyltransferase [Candidatus Daviesbacteria bacterium]